MDRPPSGPGRGDGSQLRFAIVGPLLASPPPKGGLQAEFRRLSERVWTDAEEGRQRTFSASTIERWRYAALRADDDTMRPLRRRVRKDAGGRRAASAELIEALAAQYRRWSWWSVDLHHKNLVALLAERPGIGPVPSVSTLRRIMKDRGLARRPKPRPGDPPRRVRRETLAYEHGHSNSLWHADFHWAPFSITTRKGEVVRPRLLAILDDHSRICAHAQWYLGETSEAFVHGLSQAFMKLGLPRSLMTDNGSPMIAGEVAQGLRDLGVTFAGIPPRTPEHNAKVERFWGTVEGQLLAMFHPNAPPAWPITGRRAPGSPTTTRTRRTGSSARRRASATCRATTWAANAPLRSACAFSSGSSRPARCAAPTAPSPTAGSGSSFRGICATWTRCSCAWRAGIWPPSTSSPSANPGPARPRSARSTSAATRRRPGR